MINHALGDRGRRFMLSAPLAVVSLCIPSLSHASAYCMGVGIVAQSAATKLNDGASLAELIDAPQATYLTEDTKSRNRLVILLANQILRGGHSPEKVASIVRGVCEGQLREGK